MLGKTTEEIEEVLDEVTGLIDNGETKFHGMSYEEGVKYALEWVLGEGEHPLND